MSNIASYKEFKQKVVEGYKRMSRIADDSDLINVTAMNQYNRERLIHSGTMIPLDEDGNALIHAGTLYGKEYVHVEPNYYGKGQPRYWYDQQAYDNWVKAGRPGPGASNAANQNQQMASDRTAYERQKALSTYGGNPITRTPFTNVNYSVNKPAQSTNNQNSGDVMLNTIKLMNPQINDMLAAKQAREQHEYKKTFTANSNAEGLKRAQAGQYTPGAANSLNSSVQQTTGRNIANIIAKNGTTSGGAANSLNSEIQRSSGRDEEAKARAAGKTHADTMNKMMLQTQANKELPMKNGVAQRLSNAPGEQAQGQAMQAKQMSDVELLKMAGRENNYNMQSRSLTPDQQRERDRQLDISRQNAQKTAQSQGSAAANAQKYIDLTRQSPKTAVDQYIKDNSDIANALNVLKSAIKSGKATLGKGSFNTSNATVQSVMDQLESKAQKDGNSIGGRNGAFYKELSTRIYNELKNAQSEHNSGGNYTERSSAAQQDRYAADDRLQYERQKAREARDKANPYFRSNSADQAAYEETARENYEKLQSMMSQNQKDPKSSAELATALRRNIKFNDDTEARDYAQQRSQDQEQERILSKQVDDSNESLNNYVNLAARFVEQDLQPKEGQKRMTSTDFNVELASRLADEGIGYTPNGHDNDYDYYNNNIKNNNSYKNGSRDRERNAIKEFWNKIYKQGDDSTKNQIGLDKALHQFSVNNYEDQLYTNAKVVQIINDIVDEYSGRSGYMEDRNKKTGEASILYGILNSYMSRLKHSAIEESLTPQEEFELFKQKVEAGKTALDNYRNAIIVHGGIAEYATELKKKSILN